MNDDFLFVNKYAPSCIEECILPEEIKKFFIDLRTTGNIPNLVLDGPPGIGKTSTIQTLAKELGCDFMKINGSDEGRYIDTIREQVKGYASSVSLSKRGKKILLIDEADNMTNDAQKILLGVIEKLQSNCSFVFTSNNKYKLIPAILSRGSTIDFSIHVKEKPKLAMELFNRIEKILKSENIEYEQKILIELVQKYFPDFRKTLNELQRFTSSGKLEIISITALSNADIFDLMTHLKGKNFTEVRKWAAMNISNNVSKIFKQLYTELPKLLEPRSIPVAIITLSEYQYKSAFVQDQEINLVACLIELMAEVNFL
jgi:DNA polymerase III delta prime subunit